MLNNAGMAFPTSMADQAPFFPLDLKVKKVLSSSSPYFFVGDTVWPLDVEYVLEKSVYKCLCNLCVS